MQTQTIAFDKDHARDLWRAYRKHQHYSDPLDQEIAAIYKMIAQGRTVIRAIASIVQAGLYADGPYKGLPKLAICRADIPKVHLRRDSDGGAKFLTQPSWRRSNEARSRSVSIPPGSWPAGNGFSRAEALTPSIPLHLRPKRGLENYHVLWEAEWKPVPPGDPLLLRRIGESDAWLVAAAWDLTEVERAVLATRLNG